MLVIHTCKFKPEYVLCGSGIPGVGGQVFVNSVAPPMNAMRRLQEAAHLISLRLASLEGQAKVHVYVVQELVSELRSLVTPRRDVSCPLLTTCMLLTRFAFWVL